MARTLGWLVATSMHRLRLRGPMKSKEEFYRGGGKHPTSSRRSQEDCTDVAVTRRNMDCGRVETTRNANTCTLAVARRLHGRLQAQITTHHGRRPMQLGDCGGHVHSGRRVCSAKGHYQREYCNVISKMGDNYDRESESAKIRRSGRDC